VLVERSGNESLGNKEIHARFVEPVVVWRFVTSALNWVAESVTFGVVRKLAVVD